MSYQTVAEKLRTRTMNRNGFTFLMAIFMVMIVGILSAFTGKSWTMIMKREKEKELLFRGSQIKEAIENWYKQDYNVKGVRWTAPPKPLMELKDLLENPHIPSLRYLPHSYAADLDDSNPKCDPDCAKIKVNQDPMTGKEWTLIRGNVNTAGKVITLNPGGGIVGVASKSDETPIKTDFKDTALENMIVEGDKFKNPDLSMPLTPPKDPLEKKTKYSDWKFIYDPANDHKKIYRAYHEGW